VQETLLRAWEHPEVSDDGERSARAWLLALLLLDVDHGIDPPRSPHPQGHCEIETVFSHARTAALIARNGCQTMTHSRHTARCYRLSDNRTRHSPGGRSCGVTVKSRRPQLRDVVPLMTHPQRDYRVISPLNAGSLAKKRQPTCGRKNLADPLLSLATMEFQDPTLTRRQGPEAKSDRNDDRDRSRVGRHSANDPGFRHTPVGGRNCRGGGHLLVGRHRHDDHPALHCHGGSNHNRSGSINQHPKPSTPWLTPLTGATLPATCPA
jgi:hypothetical protein